MSYFLKRPATCVSVVLSALLILLVFFAVAGSAAPPPGDEEFGTIADASNALLNSSPVLYIDPPALMALLDDNNDGVIDASDNPANDPLVIDVRSSAAYAGTAGGMGNAGHIPGAINIGYTAIDTPANLALIRSELAKHANKTIVLACFSGHTDKLSEMALGAVAQAGYFGSPAPTVTALKWGNLGWNTPSEPSVLAEVDPASPTNIYQQTYSIDMVAHALPAPGAYPVINNTTSTEPAEITRVADNLAITLAGGPFIFPGTGAGQVNDTNIANYTVVDVRSAADYAAGHIPGAVNIPYQQLFATDGGGDYTNLLSIDLSKPVIVYSNAQFEANAASIGMNALGIRNAGAKTRSLRFGVASWNNTLGMKFDTATEEHSYPVVAGSSPGGLNYVSGCSTTKASLMLGAPVPYWGSYADYVNGILSIDWTVSNTGSSIAYDVALTGSTNTNGVTVSTALPLTLSNIMSPAGSAGTTLKYNLPPAVGSFHSSMTGSSTDGCNNSSNYP